MGNWYKKKFGVDKKSPNEALQAKRSSSEFGDFLSTPIYSVLILHFANFFRSAGKGKRKKSVFTSVYQVSIYLFIFFYIYDIILLYGWKSE